MAVEIKAPGEYALDNEIIFLAGSIEMGAAEDWQTRLTKDLNKYDITILNPRRDDWDNSWEQTIQNDKFREQVEWELDGLENADIVIVYFDPNTKSPITLLELGLLAERPCLTIVCCPDGFYRKGNVEIVCERYDMIFITTYDEMLEQLKELYED